jgi:hypothetical protein
MDLIIQDHSVRRPNARITRLGELGEALAEEALRATDFVKIRNLNRERNNQPYADLLAEREGTRYFIGVKARNELQVSGALNPTYNLFLIPYKKNSLLRDRGVTVDEITRHGISQIHQLAAHFDAIPAWITVPIRSYAQTYAVYFGLLEELGNRRSIPMTEKAIKSHECLRQWTKDARITADLSNQF